MCMYINVIVWPLWKIGFNFVVYDYINKPTGHCVKWNKPLTHKANCLILLLFEFKTVGVVKLEDIWGKRVYDDTSRRVWSFIYQIQ